MLGKISGKITTTGFGFEAEARVKKLDYIAVKDPEGRWILACIDSIVREGSSTIARANIIGYRDRRGFLKTPKVPFSTGTPIFPAEKDFIKEVLGLEGEGAYVGLLEGYDIKVKMPIEHIIKKHMAILAKTGTGKSYAAGIILEEMAENKIPVIIIDPHGEYSTLGRVNKKDSEIRLSERFGIKPRDYKEQIQIFGINKGKQIRLDSRLSLEDLTSIIPTKLSPSQRGLLYSVIRNMEGESYTLRDVIESVEGSRSQSKWNLMPLLELLERTGLFSANPTRPEELVKEGRVSIVDLKEAKPEIQQMVVLKLAEDLFNARKRGKIPPFLLVLEEAHNFCPERGFGEAASSGILRTIASEGRKFGMGLCVISQRPARIDKSVLSQCNTQIILKVTNPNDLKAITDSVEGVTPGLKEEIRDLPVGVALVVGITEQPLLVDIRVRKSQHGGESIGEDFIPEEKVLVFEPRLTKGEMEKRFGEGELRFLNYPLWEVECKGQKFVYVDGITGEVLFKREGYIERSKGIKSLLGMGQLGRSIMLYLSKYRFATLDSMAYGLDMESGNIQSEVKRMMNNGLIKTDGYAFTHSEGIDVPFDIEHLQVGDNLSEKDSKDITLNFSVSGDSARAIPVLWGLEVIKVGPVYYPYWVIKEKGKHVLIDAVNARVDPLASENVQRVI